VRGGQAGACRQARARREAVRYRKFSQLLRDLRGVRPRRSDLWQGLSKDAKAPARRNRLHRGMKPALFFLLLFAGLLAARLSHSKILWAEETLPLAAAAQMEAGKALYRDIWFDKPPLLA